MVNNKKLLLINDTGETTNPGCKMVREAFYNIFNPTIGKGIISDRLPLGYWAEHYNSIADKPAQCITQQEGYFPVGADIAPAIDFGQWQHITESLGRSDRELQKRIEKCDAVIVNGEGSIHHNLMRALALFGLMRTCVLANKPVLLLNSTIQAMDTEILKSVLGDLQILHTRERRSFDEIQKNYCTNTICAPDLAFLAVDRQIRNFKHFTDAKQCCIITAGVAVSARTLDILFDTIFQLHLTPVYLCIGDGGEAELAKRICAQRKVALVNAWEIPVDEIVGFLSQFKIAISGRHHINIFLLCAGVPFVAIPSNTWKIEQTLLLVNYPVDVVRRVVDLEKALNLLIKSLCISSNSS